MNSRLLGRTLAPFRRNRHGARDPKAAEGTSVRPRGWAAAAGGITLLLGALPGPATSAQLAPTASASPLPQALPQAHAVDSVLRAEMRKRHIPGLQAAVVRGGRVVFSAAYGVADLETGAPVTPATIFTLNSSTKAFTGVAVMQLVQAGRLSLDAPVSRYLDSLPPAWRPVTLRQLPTHVSGLPDVIIQPKSQGTGTLVGDGGEASAWAAVRALPIESAPGVTYRYNQTNYVLLGKVIDRVTGGSFAAFMRRRQFDVVGMPHAVFGDARTIVPGRARTYRYAAGQLGAAAAAAPLEHAFDDFAPFLRTAGGLNGTAEEVARWLIAVQGGKLLENGETANAVAVFKLNTELFPASANTHDSLAEAYEAAGGTELAAASYRRSLALDPANDHARGRLDALRTSPGASRR